MGWLGANIFSVCISFMDNQNNQTTENSQKGNDLQKILGRLKLNSKRTKAIIAILAIILVSGFGYYFYNHGRQIYTDKAEISAPLISLSYSGVGTLQEILVKNGDRVSARTPVARMENGFVRAETDGVIVGIDNEIGKIFSPGEPVVTMINTNDLRVVAHIAENKGLSSVNVGQKVMFRVDAFGSKKFYGTVEEIAKTADQSSVVFSISDKREEKEFSVKIKYDVKAYPELLNGMSAKVWIEK